MVIKTRSGDSPGASFREGSREDLQGVSSRSRDSQGSRVVCIIPRSCTHNTKKKVDTVTQLSGEAETCETGERVHRHQSTSLDEWL